MKRKDSDNEVIMLCHLGTRRGFNISLMSANFSKPLSSSVHTVLASRLRSLSA